MPTFKPLRGFVWKDFLPKLGIIVFTIVAITWMMPGKRQSSFYAEVGKPWRFSDLTAQFDFPIYKSNETIKRERDSLMRVYEPYYTFDTEVGGKLSRKFASDYSGGIEGVSDDFISVIANRIRSLHLNAIIGAGDYNNLNHDTTTTKIRIVSGKNAVSVTLNDVLTEKEAYEKLLEDEKLEAYVPALQKCNLDNYITPTLIYDKEKSEAVLQEMLDGIPLACGIIQKGQKIISQGDIVEEGTYRILESLQIESNKRSDNGSHHWINTLGEAFYVSLLILIFTFYLLLFRKEYFENTRNIAMLYSLIIIFVLITSILCHAPLAITKGSSSSLSLIIPYAITAILARIFTDTRTAFITTVTMILICANMLEQSFEFIIIQSVVALVAIYSIRELQFRSQLFRTVILIILSSLCMELAFDLMRASSSSVIIYNKYTYLLISGVFTLFAFPLIFVIEKLFGFTSDMTLVELSNTNHALLRQLSEEAPGTFQHSIQVSNLASAVASKIGGSPQLVRAGALYHDIGKTKNPIYFTENQSGIDPHANLTYIESAQYIISHVTSGLKMAEKAGLPSVIKDFISTHHGLGKAKFFYLKYKEEHPGEPIDELLFTYPGPNPHTKEQAILMMVDAVEAASRSLPDYSDVTIRTMVENIVDNQLKDGFFKECPITFRDISWAKTVLIEKLKTIYHTRISYPKEDEIAH